MRRTKPSQRRFAPFTFEHKNRFAFTFVDRVTYFVSLVKGRDAFKKQQQEQKYTIEIIEVKNENDKEWSERIKSKTIKTRN